MKHFVGSTVITGLALAACIATSPIETMAAAAAPVLSVTNGKAFDGTASAHGAPVVAADGINIYSAFVSPDSNSIKIVKSNDGGITWGGAHKIFTIPADGTYLGGRVSIAVSGDPTVPAKKIIHVVWSVVGEIETIKYAWADTANLDAWSEPVNLNAAPLSLYDPNVTVTPTGKIFVKGQDVADGPMYIMISEGHDLPFTSPSVIPVSETIWTSDDSEIFADQSGNVHMSYPYCIETGCGIKYTRLPAGSTTWSEPTIAVKPVMSETLNGLTGLVAYDASNIYIASVYNRDLTFVASADGGDTWTAPKTVLAHSTGIQTGSYVDITVNANRAITIGAPVDILDAEGNTVRTEARIYRSTDSGVSWSSATKIPNAHFISMAVDGNGKEIIMTRGGRDGENAGYVSKESNKSY